MSPEKMGKRWREDGQLAQWITHNDSANHKLKAKLTPEGYVCATTAISQVGGWESQGEQAEFFHQAALPAYPVQELLLQTSSRALSLFGKGNPHDSSL